MSLSEEEVDVDIAGSNDNNANKIKAARNNRAPTASLTSNTWYHVTIGSVFFFFMTAYMLQTGLVRKYIKEALLFETYSVLSNSSSDIHETLLHPPYLFNWSTMEDKNDLDQRKREHNLEKSVRYWNRVLLLIYAVPTLILAPLFGSWADRLHRIIPMYLCTIATAISSLCIALAMSLASSVQVVVYCSLPSGLTGGAVVFTIAMYSYIAEKNKNFQIFEWFLMLQCIYIAAKTLVQCLIITELAKVILIWLSFAFSLIPCFGLLHHRITDYRYRLVKVKFCLFAIINLLTEFICMIFSRLSVVHLSLLFCVFILMFTFNGEMIELTNILVYNEPWQISSFSTIGTFEGFTKTAGLIITFIFWKYVILKKIKNKRFYFLITGLCVLTFVLDATTKVIISVTPQTFVHYWGPFVCLLSEVPIVVIRYFLLLLVSKEDIGKVISLFSITQVVATIASPISAKAIHLATFHWFQNFVYLFLGLLQIIPVAVLLIMMKFVKFPNFKCQVNEEQGKKENVINDNERSIDRMCPGNITTF